MQGRLNSFQQSMLQWNDLHPYNAVHVVRIHELLEIERLKTLISTLLESKGLTGLVLDRRARCYHYRGGVGAPEIKILAVEAGWSTGLVREVEAQLNTPFIQAEPFTPFRFFVVPERDSFCLGLAYFHPAADGDCILTMLREIVETYQTGGDPCAAKPVERYPACWGNSRLPAPGVVARKLLSLPSSVSDMRKTRRLHYQDASNLENKFDLFSLGPEMLSGMIQAAKSWGVTLNDVFLGLLMKAVSRVAPDRLESARRRGIALGCIVNIRKDLGLQTRRVFGVFLGSFVVHHEVPPGISLADLAGDLRKQTLKIKQRRLYLGASVELAIGRFMSNLCSQPRRKAFYQKNYPLWGGISNLDLNPIWPQAEGARPIDYFRAVSTGPVTPLVLSITTVGKVVNIGLTYRSTVFAGVEIEMIKRSFMEPESLLAGNL